MYHIQHLGHDDLSGEVHELRVRTVGNDACHDNMRADHHTHRKCKVLFTARDGLVFLHVLISTMSQVGIGDAIVWWRVLAIWPDSLIVKVACVIFIQATLCQYLMYTILLHQGLDSPYSLQLWACSTSATHVQNPCLGSSRQIISRSSLRELCLSKTYMD